MIELPADFIERMKSECADFDGFLKSYERPAARAIRVNTLKISVEDFKKLSPFSLQPVAWEKSGFYVEQEGLGKTVFHAAGLYYVQEPSAMSAVPELELSAGERVLDMCAAPGGKSTQIAQYLCGDGILFSNEIDYPRSKILSGNVERLGVKNAVVTCGKPEEIAQNFSEYFDKVLVDAPCSGEGMFKKEKNAVPEWSAENVKMCAERQNRILDCAAKTLAVGGRLVYSTCTFSREEDERQIENFLKTHKEFTLVKQDKLLPHVVRGEGHYFAVLQKNDGVRCEKPLLTPCVKDKKQLAAYSQWAEENLKTRFENIHSVGQTLYSLPDGMPRTTLQIMRCGVRLGEFTSNRFEPSHSLAMCLNNKQVCCIEVDEATAVQYLKGLTFGCAENERGWRLVTHNGFALGWCKAVGGVAKNHLPKGLRI